MTNVNQKITETPTDLKKKQDYLFQFIDHKTGARSEPFISDYKQLTEILRARTEDDKPDDEDYILLVAVMDDKQTHIPATPLIHVSRLLETMPHEEQQ